MLKLIKPIFYLRRVSFKNDYMNSLILSSSSNNNGLLSLNKANLSFLRNREFENINLKENYENLIKNIKGFQNDKHIATTVSSQIQKIIEIKQNKKYRTGINETHSLDFLIQIIISSKIISKEGGKEEQELKTSIVNLLEFEFSLYNISLVNRNIQEKLFKLLSITHSQNLHTFRLYQNLIMGITTESIFPSFNPERFFVLVLYTLEYEKDVLKSKPFTECVKYIFMNSHQFYLKNNRKDIVTITEALSIFDNQCLSLSNHWKTLILNEIKSNLFSDDQVLKLFTYFCRGNIITIDLIEIKIFEDYFAKSDWNKLSNESFQKPFIHFNQIYRVSKIIGMKILNQISQRYKVIDNRLLKNFFLNYQNAPNYDKFDIMINEKIKSQYSTMDLSTLSDYLYFFSINKMIDLNDYSKIESQILKNLHSHKWSSLELHHIFASYLELSYFSSEVLEKLIPIVSQAIITENNYSNKVTLLWDVAKSNYSIPHLFFEKFLVDPGKKIFDLELNVAPITTLCLSLCQNLVKLVIQDKENFEKGYREKYAGSFVELLDTLILKFNIIKSLDSMEIEDQIRIIHFILCLKYVFPEQLKKYDDIELLLKNFQNKKFNFRGTQSNLMIDVTETLKFSNISFEIEKRIYGFLIDIFISPNIIIEVDGIKHFHRKTQIKRFSDTFKDFLLEKSGYKIIRIPYYEFKENFFTDQIQRGKYLLNKINGTKDMSTL